MRKFILLLIGILFMSTSFTSAHAQVATPTPQQQESLVQLPNGLQVLIKQDDRFPLVSLRLYVHAGSVYETPEQAGISHILEHMVFKGTSKRPKGAVATDVEKSGGYLNAATSFDYTVYLTDMTKDHWKLGLDVLKDMAFSPTLDPQELESEKEVIVAELKRGEDSPGGRLFRLTQANALAGTPYDTPIIGYEKTIRAVTPETIRAYINQHYQPQNMLLLVCGNVNKEEVLAEVTSQFGSLANTHAISPKVPLDESAVKPVTTPLVQEVPWNKVSLSVSFPVPGQEDVRSPAIEALSFILGGDATSRFYRKYKYERREVDNISVSNYNFAQQGLLYITVTLDADKIPSFWQEFTKDLASLSTTAFTNQELDRAKLQIEDDLMRSKETLAGLASKLGYFQFFGKGEYSELNYLRAIAQTNTVDLSLLAMQIFEPSRMATVCLVPEKTPAPAGSATMQAFLEQTIAQNWHAPQTTTTVTPVTETAKADATQTIDLGNGRTLILLPDATLPYASVTMAFAGGDALLTSKTEGLGAYTAALLSKGTAKLSATEFEDFQSDRAASFSATSGRQTFTVSVDSPSRFLPEMFQLLESTLTTPAFLEVEGARVQQNQIAAITMREDQPTGLAFRRLFPFLFSQHPYGYLQLGEKENVATFTAATAKEFWQKQMQQPWVMSVCGTFNAADVIEAAKKLPTPSAPAVTIAAPKWNKEKNLALNLAGREQSHLLMVFPTASIGSQDEAGIDLLQNILAGQSGLLFAELRDKQGLGYTVTAIPWKSIHAGALIFYIGTAPEKVAQAKDGFIKIINQLHTTKISDADIERGKNQMMGDYYREHQSLGSRSAEAALLTILGRPLDADKKNIDKAQTITADELQQLAKKYISPEKAYTITVTP